MRETVGSVSDTRIWAGPQPTDLTIDTLTFTVPTMAPPTRIILAFGGFRRPIVPASGGVCGSASENKQILQLIRLLRQRTCYTLTHGIGNGCIICLNPAHTCDAIGASLPLSVLRMMRIAFVVVLFKRGRRPL